MAEPVWLGTALAIAQVDTIVVGGTWATSETATISSNGNDLVITLGSNVTTADVATAIANAINATSALDGTGTPDATSNVGGQQINELSEVSATVSGSTVTVTARTAGKPFTISVSETSTSGTLTHTSAATAATGPNHWDNADNWSTGAVPVSTDDVVIDHRGLSDILYGLNQSSVALNSLTITNGFTKSIGLTEINSDSASKKYAEYRPTYLSIQTGSLSIHGDGSGSPRIKIDLGSATATTCDIESSGRASTTESDGPNMPAVLLKGTNAANILRVTKGDVGFAYLDGESGHLATLHCGPDSGARVRCGDGVDLGNATITVSGGTLDIDSQTGAGSSITLTDGEAIIRSGAHQSIVANGGSVDYRSSGTLTQGRVGSDGEFIFSTDKSRTVTNFEVAGGGRLKDVAKTVTWTNGIDLYRRGLESSELDIGQHFTLTPSVL